MSAILLPLAATAAAGAVTYWCCVRPMRRGKDCASSEANDDQLVAGTDLDEQLLAARAELDHLRASTTSANSESLRPGSRPSAHQ